MITKATARRFRNVVRELIRAEIAYERQINDGLPPSGTVAKLRTSRSRFYNLLETHTTTAA